MDDTNKGADGRVGDGNGGNGPPTISLPKGGGAIRDIGEKFSVNPVTGTASLSVPIFTSPSRSDFYPRLSLAYDSGSGNGPFGLGWSLSVPSVTRKTDKGLPQYQDTQSSDVFILSEAEDLVPVLLPSAGGFVKDVRTATDAGRAYDVLRYRPRIEGLFARIERWQDQSTGEIHWRSVSKDNITSLYGTSPGSRIADPADSSRVFRWLLDQSYDDKGPGGKGNVIIYEYKQEDQQGIDPSLPQEANKLANGLSFANRYLKRIKYGKKAPGPQDDHLFEVVFDYGEHDPTSPTPDEVQPWAVRLDPFSSFRATFEIRDYRCCCRVLMFHLFSELGATPYLVRSTDFQYAENPVASYLSSITQTGYTRDSATGAYQQKSLPALKFTYSQPTIDPTVHFIDRDSLENLPVGLDNLRYQWVDLNSEGISGILVETSDAWFYKSNLGNAQFAPVQLLGTQPSLANPGSGRQQIMDLAGDGEKCLVQFSEPLAGYYERDEENQWQAFTPFPSNPNIPWNDPNLRLLDLNGDGFSDILISEDNVFLWSPSLTNDGFGPLETVGKATDEEQGPALVFADPTQSIYLADMTGDGLTDIVRIRNGEVCYWANEGYGQFSAKVTMDAAPLFDYPDYFDQKCIRLADTDGSGTTDIIYLGRDSVTLYFNQSGNSWSAPQTVADFPPTDDLSTVDVIDLFGNGTACMVWSSPLPGATEQPMQYIDLMGGQKPHLLMSIDNNMGKKTDLQYAPSTQFYLADLAAGTPWITKLPFPVQVVTTVTTQDLITGNQLATTSAYHHGYYDGIEREFRGFGMVEQRDTQSFAQYAGAGKFGEPLDKELYVPPTCTKTWFSTGAFIDRNKITRRFAHKYYAGDAQAVDLADTLLPDGLSAQEEEEALRSLKGRMLRQEIYADDGSALRSSPYSVTENNYTIRMVQPVADNPNEHAVFYTSPRETVTYYYERDAADPRLSHSMTLEEDDFGNVTKSVAIGYPRRTPAFPEQGQTLVTYNEADFINVPDNPAFYRIGVPSEARAYEITGLSAPVGGVFSLADVAKAIPTSEILYEAAPTPGVVQKRLFQRSRTLYYQDDLAGPLALGNVESHALVYQTLQMAFTPGLLTEVYGARVNDDLLRKEGAYIKGADYKARTDHKGRPLFPPTDDNDVWWLPSGTRVFDPAQFFMPIKFADPFGNTTALTYDAYALLLTQTSDALTNTVSASSDYRVLQPYVITDSNGNRSEVQYDLLGMVAGTAVMGKEIEPDGKPKGDSLAGFVADLDPLQLNAFLADPVLQAPALLGSATTRIVYDLDRFYKTRNDNPSDSTAWKPVFAAIIARETHVSDLAPGQESKIQISFSYSDGFGREIQKKIQAEPGLAPERGPDGTLNFIDTSPNVRWVGTGRTVFDNKGNAVEKYEPFFSVKSDYEDEADLVQWGVTPVLHYDPLSRLIRTDNPNGTFAQVEFDPWQQITSDENDTVLNSQWYADRLALDATIPANVPEIRAAKLTAAHANTPTVANLDVMGRTFLTVADNGTAADGTPQKYATHLTLDIQGNQRVITDARGNAAMTNDFDLLKRNLHSNSVDAGERWMLQNVLGNPIRGWNSRGFQTRAVYDELHRRTHLFVQQAANPELLAERLVCVDRPDSGWTLAQGQAANARGKAYQSLDAAGVVTNQQYDFKGNLLAASRQLGAQYKQQMDWSPIATLNDIAAVAAAARPLLGGETFPSSTTYDALNRPVALTTPDSSVIVPTYNQANLLEQVSANLRGAAASTPFITNLDYNAKGQRELCEYGNGASTAYQYDPKTFRLTQLTTTRSSDRATLQALTYLYDPVRNITEIDAAAQQTVFFRNAMVTPTSQYVYDAIYRLVSASGREHLGQTAAGTLNPPQPVTDDDSFRTNLPQPGDGNAMGNYMEQYQYDAVGNILSTKHSTASGNWNRTYAYDEPNPKPTNNRLTSTAIGGVLERYQYDANGNMITMPHLPLMQWDFKDQLQATSQQVVNSGAPETTYYVYDAAGQRVRKVTELQAAVGALPVRKSERIYLGGYEVYREYDVSGTIVTLERQTLHVMDDNRRVCLVETKTIDASVAVLSPTPLARYQLDNHLGSAILELDGSAAIISYEEYYPYGGTSYQAVASAVEVSSKRYRYTGKERDDETGLSYHGARYYACWLGRWTSCDPAGVVDGTDLYVYVRNGPSNVLDRTGTQGEASSSVSYHGSLLEMKASAANAEPVGRVPSFSVEGAAQVRFGGGNFALGGTGTFYNMEYELDQPPYTGSFNLDVKWNSGRSARGVYADVLVQPYKLSLAGLRPLTIEASRLSALSMELGASAEVEARGQTEEGNRSHVSAQFDAHADIALESPFKLTLTALAFLKGSVRTENTNWHVDAQGYALGFASLAASGQGLSIHTYEVAHIGLSLFPAINDPPAAGPAAYQFPLSPPPHLPIRSNALDRGPFIVDYSSRPSYEGWDLKIGAGITGAWMNSEGRKSQLTAGVGVSFSPSLTPQYKNTIWTGFKTQF